jgi:hypothetical protein
MDFLTEQGPVPMMVTSDEAASILNKRSYAQNFIAASCVTPPSRCSRRRLG